MCAILPTTTPKEIVACFNDDKDFVKSWKQEMMLLTRLIRVYMQKINCLDEYLAMFLRETLMGE